MAKRIPWKEYPDPTPLVIETDLKAPETIEQKIQRILRTDLASRLVMSGEVDTPEEAMDYVIPDGFEDDEVFSKYEMDEMIEEDPLLIVTGKPSGIT